jgi:hypothetical protein
MSDTNNARGSNDRGLPRLLKISRLPAYNLLTLSTDLVQIQPGLFKSWRGKSTVAKGSLGERGVEREEGKERAKGRESVRERAREESRRERDRKRGVGEKNGGGGESKRVKERVRERKRE